MHVDVADTVTVDSSSSELGKSHSDSSNADIGLYNNNVGPRIWPAQCLHYTQEPIMQSVAQCPHKQTCSHAVNRASLA